MKAAAKTGPSMPTAAQLRALAIHRAQWDFDMWVRSLDRDEEAQEEWDVEQSMLVVGDMLESMKADGDLTYDQFERKWSKVVSVVKLSFGSTKSSGICKKILECMSASCEEMSKLNLFMEEREIAAAKAA